MENNFLKKSHKPQQEIQYFVTFDISPSLSYSTVPLAVGWLVMLSGWLLLAPPSRTSESMPGDVTSILQQSCDH